jgi:glucose-1-phosphate cytidylyltransferase
MKVVILAGGLGSRLGEETVVRPKPMVEIGGKPILWHIMKIYSAYGISDFIICLGYKGNVIKEYFSNYFLFSSDVTIDLAENSIQFHENKCEPWRITLVDTGKDSMTGGRLKRVLPYVADDDAFCLTYGDGLGDIDIPALIDFHHSKGTLATLTATQPSGRFGALGVSDDAYVTGFSEKPRGDGRWVNGGFFVLSPKVGEYISEDSTSWEGEPLERLAREGQLSAFKHSGFWQPMDTLFDRNLLEKYWAAGTAPWKIW